MRFDQLHDQCGRELLRDGPDAVPCPDGRRSLRIEIPVPACGFVCDAAAARNCDVNPTVSGAWLASATSCVSDARCSALIASSARATRGRSAKPVASPIACERFTARPSVIAQLAEGDFERLHYVRARRFLGRLRIALLDRAEDRVMSFERLSASGSVYMRAMR